MGKSPPPSPWSMGKSPPPLPSPRSMGKSPPPSPWSMGKSPPPPSPWSMGKSPPPSPWSMGKSPPPHPATSFTSFSYPHYTNIGHLLKLWLLLFTLRWNIFNLRYKLNEDFHFHRRHLSPVTSPSKGVYKQPCSLRCQYQPSLRPERSFPCSSMVRDLHPQPQLLLFSTSGTAQSGHQARLSLSLDLSTSRLVWCSQHQDQESRLF